MRSTPGSEPITEPEKLRLEYRKRMVSATAFWTILSSSGDAKRSCSPSASVSLPAVTEAPDTPRCEHGRAGRADARSARFRIHPTSRRPRRGGLLFNEK